MFFSHLGVAMTFSNGGWNQAELSPQAKRQLADELEGLILAGAIRGDEALRQYLRSLGLEAVVEEMILVIRSRRLTYRPLRQDF
jgi:hypothetical protein